MTAATPANLEQRLRELANSSIAAHFCGEGSILRDDLDLSEISESLTQAADALAAKDAIIEKARLALEKTGWHWKMNREAKFCN